MEELEAIKTVLEVRQLKCQASIKLINDFLSLQKEYKRGSVPILELEQFFSVLKKGLV